MKKVLIKPVWEVGLENRVFQTEYPRPLQLWRDAAQKEGIELCTWDMYPMEEADCVWVMDLPTHRRRIDEVRREVRPGVPLVLHIVESPLLCEKFVRDNWTPFDYVVTYERVDRANAFTYRLPVTLFPPREGLPFLERRCAIMINRNQVAGYFATRKPGLVGLPGFGSHFSGWKLPRGYLFRPAGNCLYGWRRAFARTVESIDADLLTIVGPGWKGERLSWCPFYPRRPFRCAEMDTIHRDDKFDLISNYRFGISVENVSGNLGYISEKIFDTILSGAVPVYLGEESIHEVVPHEAMVSVSDFRNLPELVAYLRDCPEEEWTTMREAGRAFLSTPTAAEFSDEAFVERMMGVLTTVLESSTTLQSREQLV